MLDWQLDHTKDVPAYLVQTADVRPVHGVDLGVDAGLPAVEDLLLASRHTLGECLGNLRRDMT